MREKIVFIDGHSILNRAFYGVPDLTNAEGLHTNGVYGFLNIMFKLLEEEKPQYLAVAFDVKAPTFRHEMYADYKGTRKPMPKELHEQVPMLKEVLAAMEIPVVELPGYEADDILGTLAKRGRQDGLEVCLVSGDRDMLQLSENHICIRIPKTKRGGTVIETYFPEDVYALYGVSPEEFIDVKALMGDPSDNIPGVPGIGEKTAISLIKEYHTIENVYEHREEIKPARAQKAISEHFDMARLSRKLALICTHAPVEFSLKEAKIGSLYTEEAFLLFKRYEFKSMLSRFEGRDFESQKPELSETFQTIEDFSGAEALFQRLGSMEPEDQAGFCVDFQGKEMFGLSIAWKDLRVYLPCQGFLTEAYLKEKMCAWLSGEGKKACIGLKEQLPFLGEYGRKELVDDAGLEGYLLNPLKNSYEYDDLAKDYLGRMFPSGTDLLGKGKGRLDRDENPEGFQAAACYEAYTAMACQKALKEKLSEEGMWKLYEEIEKPLIYSLYRMEQAGIRVDKQALLTYGEELADHIEVLEKEIYDLCGEKFNINSPKQLGEILFGRMKLPYGKKTKTGYSTAADILEKLAPDYPVVGKILEYRQYTKLKSTYADGLSHFIGEDGRIHGKFNQTITATGRISSTEPNLQNIPVRMELGRKIRKVFVPAESCVFVDADYSQIELRVLAHMSGDQSLIEAYKNAEDIHAMTASQVFHVPLSQVTPLQRRNAKAVNFGIVYGISAFGLSEDLSITRKEATEYIDQYFKTYPGIKTFLDGLVKEGKEKGYVTTLYGRRRPVPELSSSNFMQRSFGERVAMNSPIQGTAADIMKIAMVHTDRALKEKGLAARIVLQVHDELLVEAPKQEAELAAEILERCMKEAAKLAVCLEVDVHTGNSWFDTK